MPSTDILERCSDAVLVLRDGTVPCSRYVIMTECHVLRAMMDLQLTMRPDGKYEIPVVATGVEKYSNFCAIAHGVKTAAEFTFDDLVDMLDISIRLGASNIESIVMRCAWTKAPSVARAIPIIPYALRVPSIAPRVVTAMAKEYPLWRDLEINVLTRVSYRLDDPRVVEALLPLQAHYPPSIVASWLLLHSDDTTEETVMKIVTSNANLYCPDETRPVYQLAIDQYDLYPDWNQKTLKLLKSFVEATGLSSKFPQTPGGACVSQVEFEDIPRTIVSVAFAAKRTHVVKPVMLCPYVRVRMPKKSKKFGFDIRLGSIPGDSFQVRVTMARNQGFDLSFFDAWYDMTGTEGTWIESTEPIISDGLDGLDDQLADKKRTVYMRFDIYHGEKNVITFPLE
jgi:hypothetical protein